MMRWFHFLRDDASYAIVDYKDDDDDDNNDDNYGEDKY